jgi:hypothetical protein
LRAFEKSYFAAQTRGGIARAEFDFSGYGIADLVWVSWSSTQGDATAVGLEQRPQRLRLVAFELKLVDWRKALAQAFRYSYFADLAVVVLPGAVAKVARKEIAAFHQFSVGLWAFDQKTGMISKFFTPNRQRAKSGPARSRAVASLMNLAKLRQGLEKRQPFV